MSFSNPLVFSISTAQSGLSMFAQLYDYTNAIVGGQISTNFYETGNSDYVWYYDAFPYDFRGLVKFYDASNSGYLAQVALNPEEVFLPNIINDQHGSGLYNLVGGTDGSNILTINVIDQFSQIMGGVRVECRPSGFTNTLDLGFTNTSTGRTVFMLDNGNYEILVSKPQYANFMNPYWVSLTGDASIDIQGNTIILPGPNEMDTVRCYLYVSDVSLDPEASIQLTIAPSGGGETYASTNMFLKQPVSAVSDENGLVFIDIAASSGPLVAKVSSCGFKAYFNTPSSGLLNLADIVSL